MFPYLTSLWVQMEPKNINYVTADPHPTTLLSTSFPFSGVSSSVSVCSLAGRSTPALSAGSAAYNWASLPCHSCWALRENRTQCPSSSNCLPRHCTLHRGCIEPQHNKASSHWCSSLLCIACCQLDSKAELLGPQVSQSSFGQVSLVSALRPSSKK